MKELWHRLSPTGRIALITGIVTTALMVIVVARRDLARRDTGSIRGDREVWNRVTRFPGGATAYLLAGRRPA